MTNRTDNFDRANSTAALGTPSDGGSAWVAASGTWGISGNKGYPAASTTETVAYLESSVTAVEVQATMSTGATWNGLMARCGGSWTNLLLLNADTAGTIKLYKYVSGSSTQLGSTYSGAVAAGDVLKLRVDSANLITAYQNGSSRTSATDSAGSTNTKHGFWCYGTTAPRWDDLSITEIGAAADASLVYYQPAIAPLLVR